MLELEKLKLLLGISGEQQDPLLQFTLDDAKDMILAYCNIKALPEQLENTAYRMAMELYRNENLGHEETAVGSVSSISEGDTSTSFNISVSEGFKDSLLKDYKAVLSRYRRVVFK